MSMTDPIADLLARVRNGARARKEYIDCPWSVIKERVARVMAGVDEVDTALTFYDEALRLAPDHVELRLEHAAYLQAHRRSSNA